LLHNLGLNFCTQRFFYAFKGRSCIEYFEKGKVTGEVFLWIFFAGEFYPYANVELVLGGTDIGIQGGGDNGIVYNGSAKFVIAIAVGECQAGFGLKFGFEFFGETHAQLWIYDGCFIGEKVYRECVDVCRDVRAFEIVEFPKGLATGGGENDQAEHRPKQHNAGAGPLENKAMGVAGSHSNSYCLILRYSVRSDMPNSSAAFLRLPLFLVRAFLIISISCASKLRLLLMGYEMASWKSSSSWSCACIMMGWPLFGALEGMVFDSLL